jgi:valyl-tRNA synthetase
MHPTMPFLTEALWTSLTKGESLVIAEWPVANNSENDAEAVSVVNDLQRLITEIRRFRSDQGIKTSARVVAKIDGMQGALAKYEPALRFLVRLDDPAPEFKPSAKIEVGDFVVNFDLTGSIDVKAERARLMKDLEAIKKDQATAKVKLENENFMAKAPMEVVNTIRERMEFCEAEINRINALLAALPQQ